MGIIGPWIVTISPASNYFHIPESVKLLLTFLLLIGCLEVYTSLIVFIPALRKK